MYGVLYRNTCVSLMYPQCSSSSKSTKKTLKDRERGTRQTSYQCRARSELPYCNLKTSPPNWQSTFLSATHERAWQICALSLMGRHHYAVAYRDHHSISQLTKFYNWSLCVGELYINHFYNYILIPSNVHGWTTIRHISPITLYIIHRILLIHVGNHHSCNDSSGNCSHYFRIYYFDFYTKLGSNIPTYQASEYLAVISFLFVFWWKADLVLLIFKNLI